MDVLQAQDLMRQLDNLWDAVRKKMQASAVAHTLLESMRQIELCPSEIQEKICRVVSGIEDSTLPSDATTQLIAEIQVRLENIINAPIRQNADWSFFISGELRDQIERYVAMGKFENVWEYILYAGATLNWALRKNEAGKRIIAYTPDNNSYTEFSIPAFLPLKKSPPSR